MSIWNNTLKPGKPLQRKTPMHQAKPMGRSREKRGPGLAQRIAESLGRAIQHARGESSVLRSEAHRRNVAALPCACCRRPGPNQVAHVNFGKGLAFKACDSLTFPLCADEPGRRGCHSLHDQGGMPRKRRWLCEWEYVDAARAALIQRNQWPAEVEAAYQKTIQPLARVVHGEAASA